MTLLSIFAIYFFHVPCFTLMAKQASELAQRALKKHQLKKSSILSPSDLLRMLWTCTIVTWQQLKRKKVIRESHDTFMLSKLLQCHFPLNLYIYYAYVTVCTCMHVCMCNSASLDQNENVSWVLHFHHVVPGHGTQTSGLVESTFSHRAIS